MKENPEFDIFLSHNSADKPIVRKLKLRLMAESLTVWLDEDELQPGVPWQKLLEAGIHASRSVAVLVGEDGIGPWEDDEMQAALTLAVARKRPVIPVLLPGASKCPKLPMFLGNRTWVKMADELDEEAVAQLVWGVTGSKPTQNRKATAREPSCTLQGSQVVCKLSCRELATSSLHARPLAFLNTLCNKFPETQFHLSKQDPESDVLGRPANMRSGGDMMMASFKHGDMVILEVSGKLEVMASSFLKIALENLDGYSDNPVGTRKRIGQLIDQLNSRIYDPDLDEFDTPPLPGSAIEAQASEVEHRFIAVINDRLHDVTVPMIPLIAKHFESTVRIGFELAEKGVYLFTVDPENSYTLDMRIVDLDVPVGTRVTVISSGNRAEEAGMAIRDVLQNLWQCDHWLRNRAKDWDSDRAIADLLAYAKEMGRNINTAYGHVQNPFISNLIVGSVYVNPRGQSVSKHEALLQLAEPHARVYGLEVSQVLDRVEEVEKVQVVMPRPGFAIAHAAMDRSPRISISFGTYPGGVAWSGDHEAITLVAMVIYARDTYRTWADYRKKFAVLFRSNPGLQRRLAGTRTAEQFIDSLRKAEFSLVKT